MPHDFRVDANIKSGSYAFFNSVEFPLMDKYLAPIDHDMGLVDSVYVERMLDLKHCLHYLEMLVKEYNQVCGEVDQYGR